MAMNMLDRASVDRAMASIGAIDHLVLAAAGDEPPIRVNVVMRSRR
jgi:hypothetical protein